MSELRGYIPGFTLSSGKSDDRRGDGLVIHSDLGTTIVIDGFDGSSPSISLINHLKKNHYNDIDALILTHPHYDHYKGLTMIMEDSSFTIKQFYCYDPESIKFGIGNSSNGKAVKEDYDNFIKIINLAKSKNIVVKYLTTGSNPTIGDIRMRVWRKQPTKFTDNDGGNAYAFINDGSLCLYFPDLKMLVSGDGPQNLKQAIAYFKGQVKFIKIPHHGNNLTQSNAAAAKSAGCILAYETNIERNGPGTTGFTAYGTKRAKEQGIPVLMQNYDITFIASNKKMTIYQNGKSWSYNVDYGYTGEWVQDSFGYKYKENGKFITNTAYRIAGYWYYFDEKGYTRRGWHKDIDGKYRFLKSPRGEMQINTWIQVNKRWFFVDGYGRMLTGWQELSWSGGRNWFYFDKMGTMKTGWLKNPDDNLWRYLDPKTGVMLIRQWLSLNGKTYYLDGYGRMLENTTVEIDGKKYTFDKDGALIQEESDKEFKIFFINHERFTTSNNWGDNCLIESDGKFILMDTCMPNGKDAILKFLKARGVNKLSLYISHAHMDHYGNGMALLKDSYFTIEHLYMNKYGQIWDINNSNVQMHYKNMKKIGEYAKSKGIPITWLQKGTKWNIGSAQFEILYDAPMNISGLGEGGRDLLNNLSPICMVTLGNKKYLTCGDAEAAVENAVLKAGINVKADIWKMQHHGGSEGNTLAWVKAISPQFAVYNNGEGSIGNTGWTKRAVQNAHSVGAKVYNPTYHGNIIFTIKGQNISVWSERNTDKY